MTVSGSLLNLYPLSSPPLTSITFAFIPLLAVMSPEEVILANNTLSVVCKPKSIVLPATPFVFKTAVPWAAELSVDPLKAPLNIPVYVVAKLLLTNKDFQKFVGEPKS